MKDLDINPSLIVVLECNNDELIDRSMKEDENVNENVYEIV